MQMHEHEHEQTQGKSQRFAAAAAAAATLPITPKSTASIIIWYWSAKHENSTVNSLLNIMFTVHNFAYLEFYDHILCGTSQLNTALTVTES